MKTILAALLFISTAALALDRPKLQIINAASHAVEVFWIKPDGGRVSNGRIGPGQGSTIGTTLGHRFVIVDGAQETEVVSKANVQEFRYIPTTQPGGTPSHASREISGWTLHVNAKLIASDAPALEKALRLLRAQLDEIARVVPAKAVAELRKVPLYFSPVYPQEKAHAAYHPSADWLRDHGHDPVMAKCVEFTNVSIFEAETRRMPNFALHELAHAYHDRVLGFENAQIEAAFQHAKAAGKYDQVLRQDSEGRKRLDKAYAMTNAKEYFAECSEAFFSRNDFFPFTREELKQHDPEMFALLEKLWGVQSQSITSADRQRGEMAGYLFGPAEKVPEEFNGGFSLYAAAWPLVAVYPGHEFQTGLCGTWMHPQHTEGHKPEGKCYTDIEGGLGWWRDTHFPTTTPKFIMGGVGPNFSVIANGPGYGAGTWEKPHGQYGVAQLSPWLLFPLDGLNLKQGTSGELFGYGYLPLPLTNPKNTTAGHNVPTGNQCWTLFLSTANFKGPVAFFTPFFWSQATIEHPEWAGMLLDSCPAGPNKAIQMETQHVPAVLTKDSNGKEHARVAPTAFPIGPDGTSTVLHRLTAYKKAALWDDVQKWFSGGAAADGAIKPEASVVHTFRGGGGSNWSIYPPGTKREQKVPLAWKSFATSFTPNPTTFGYKWDEQLTRSSGGLVTLPEYYALGTDGKKPQWNVMPPKEVPAELGLTQHRFETPSEKPQEPRTTPDDAASCWKTPGPAAGPFKARLGDGSVVTYYWYRFADQPAMLNADLSAEEREQVQKRVEKLHRAWTKDRSYLTPPDLGTLAQIDPALVLTPPKGFEIGYVPIATRQELEK